MAFSDLEFGWYRQWFELRNVELGGVIDLLENTEEDGWSTRNPPSFVFAGQEEEKPKIEAYETYSNEMRYSALRRILRAEARVPIDSFDKMYLGVPEDKQSSSSSESQLPYLPISIREIDLEERTAASLVKAGHIGYIDPDPETPYGLSGPYAELYVPKEVFDSLDQLTSDPDIVIEVGLAIKGWRWLGPIADSEIYVSNKETQPADLLTIQAKRKIRDNLTDLYEIQTEEEDTEIRSSEVALAQISQQLAHLQKVFGHVQIAAWTIAIATVITALVLVN